MAVGEGPLPHVEGDAGGVEALVDPQPQVVADPPRAGGQAVGHRERIGVAREGGVVAQGGEGAQDGLGVGVGGQVDPEGEAGVGVEAGDDHLQPVAHVGAGAGDRGPPQGPGPEAGGALHLELTEEGRSAPGEGRALGDPGQGDAPLGGTAEDRGQVGGRDAPVGLEVAVDEHHGAGPGLLDAALDRLPLPPVAQEAGVDRGVGPEVEPERLARRPALGAAQQVGA